MSEIILSTNKLSKSFGNGRGAMDIEFQLKAGEITGFIGPNGAGKTTTIRMLMGLLRPDSGSLKILGHEIKDGNLRDVIAHIGYLPSEIDFYHSFSVREIFAYASKLLGSDCLPDAITIANTLELDLDRKIGQLSMGNKKKVGIIHALMHKPKLTILDEATSGLDPLIQSKVLALLRQARTAGSAILLSSHTLSEVEQVCDNIVMIKEACIILKDTTQNVLEQSLKKFRFTGLAQNVRTEILKVKGIAQTRELGSELIVYIADPKPILTILSQHQIYNFYLERTTLEEMFLNEYSK
jgi:ABC-2 type transport system ATP-binding protein